MFQLEFDNLKNLVFIILPILCLFFLIAGFHKKEKIMVKLKLSINHVQKFLEIAGITLGTLLILFSLLGPKTLQGYTEVERKGLDIYILMDTSKSMLVDDIKPNRISRAKRVVEEILNQLGGDRISFIPFTSSAYVQMPLTDDYELARMFLDVTDTEMISGSGTNIGAALALAGNSFERTKSADKVAIIISDGEEHDKKSAEVLKKLKSENLHVYTIGVGTKKGGLIPVYDEDGNQITDYMRNKEGGYVTSKLEPETLMDLASLGHGTYYQAQAAGDEITALMKDISALKQDVLRTDQISKYKHLYQYFLGAGLGLILLSYLLPTILPIFTVQRRKGGVL